MRSTATYILKVWLPSHDKWVPLVLTNGTIPHFTSEIEAAEFIKRRYSRSVRPYLKIAIKDEDK